MGAGAGGGELSRKTDLRAEGSLKSTRPLTCRGGEILRNCIGISFEAGESLSHSRERKVCVADQRQ